MSLLRTTRRLGSWFVGVFLLAQLAGVVPLMSAHAQHTLAASSLATGDGVQAHGAIPWNEPHHHGTADLSDECCALHGHLIAVVPNMWSAERGGFMKGREVAQPVNSLAGIEPTLADPPPKTP